MALESLILLVDVPVFESSHSGIFSMAFVMEIMESQVCSIAPA